MIKWIGIALLALIGFQLFTGLFNNAVRFLVVTFRWMFP